MSVLTRLSSSSTQAGRVRRTTAQHTTSRWRCHRNRPRRHDAHRCQWVSTISWQQRHDHRTRGMVQRGRSCRRHCIRVSMQCHPYHHASPCLARARCMYRNRCVNIAAQFMGVALATTSCLPDGGEAHLLQLSHSSSEASRFSHKLMDGAGQVMIYLLDREIPPVSHISKGWHDALMY